MDGKTIKKGKKNPLSPDLILLNANVVTLDPVQPRAELVVIRGDKVLFCGDNRDVRELRAGRSTVIDCRGKTVLPGFNDAHLHFTAYAESLVCCSFGPKEVHSIAGIQAEIRNFAQELPSGTWVKARAYDEFYLDEKRHPTRWDLDRATSTHPVKLTHRSGHAHVLNSLAMAIVGISAETSERPGTIIERDLRTGEPNGVLFEMGPYLSTLVPSLNDRDRTRGVKQAGQQLLSLGITSFQDASPQNDLNRWRLFQHWKTRGDLKCRVNMMLDFEAFASYRQRGFPHVLRTDQLRISGVKIIVNEATGQLHPPQPELNEMVLQIHQSGLQVAIHAIEEAPIAAACSAIECALHELPQSDHRHRIEHCSVCPASLSKRLGSLGVMVVTQPSFIYYNGDRYLRTVPRSHLKHLYPIATLMDSGVTVAGSSDCPVVPPNPMIGIYSAAVRSAKTGETVVPDEKVAPLQALRMYTEYAARTTFEETIKGSITPGKLADLVVLSGDPTTAPAEEIKDIEVDTTILNGKVVWNKAD